MIFSLLYPQGLQHHHLLIYPLGAHHNHLLYPLELAVHSLHASFRQGIQGVLLFKSRNVFPQKGKESLSPVPLVRLLTVPSMQQHLDQLMILNLAMQIRFDLSLLLEIWSADLRS